MSEDHFVNLLSCPFQIHKLCQKKSCPQHGQHRFCWLLGPSSKGPKLCTFPTDYGGTETLSIDFLCPLLCPEGGKGGSAGCLVLWTARRVRVVSEKYSAKKHSTSMSRGRAGEALQVVWSSDLSAEFPALGSWRAVGSRLYT